MIIKTSRRRLAAAMRYVASAHPYTVPELIALPIVAGGRPYLRWLQEACLASAGGSATIRQVARG